MQNKYVDTKEEKGEWEALWDWDGQIYTVDTIYKIDN